MKTTLCLSIALSSLALTDQAWADQRTDRVAIEKVILGLNDSPRNPMLFTPDFDGFAELARLDTSPASEVARSAPAVRTGPMAWTVVISKEPWGEATLSPAQSLPVAVLYPRPVDQGRLISRFTIQSVRFIAKDVAVVEAVKNQHYERPGPRNPWRSPALFVLKKNRKIWRIDSVHVIAQP